MENNIVLLVGPSGSGKTTIAEYLDKHYGMKSIRSYTTRAPRYPGEDSHTFISNDEFDALENIVAYTEFDGHRYCATQEQIDSHDIYVVDVHGVMTLQEHYHGDKMLLVVYLDVSPDTCRERMAERGDGGLTIAHRLANDETAFCWAKEYLLEHLEHVLILEENTVPELAVMIAKFAEKQLKEDCL